MAQETKRLLPSIFNQDIPEYLLRFQSLRDVDSFFKNVDRGNQGLTVYEENNHFVVEAALPGLAIEEIDVNLNKGVLWIKGERKESESDREKKYYHKSIHSFSYSIALPDQIDDKEEPEASYQNGILKITFNKLRSAVAKRIQIKTSPSTPS